jgi:hypothetical protein
VFLFAIFASNIIFDKTLLLFAQQCKSFFESVLHIDQREEYKSARQGESAGSGRAAPPSGGMRKHLLGVLTDTVETG